ncbi:MAG: hypothetical protein CVV27_05150 [Candidatus Melainabacteria bacterium HGW-Melainabacteria-1]|nr:MAG: hypothetical protein CVV27_05150 [Candidatus Melainabacteria bacterium HGW-Melainabacteria-1]
MRTFWKNAVKPALGFTLGLALLQISLIWSEAGFHEAKAAAGNVVAGKKIYAQRCATCHGTSGKGDGPTGKSLTPKPRDFTKAKFSFAKNDAELVAFIKKGKAPMPAWGSVLNQTQIQDVIAYIHTLKSK